MQVNQVRQDDNVIGQLRTISDRKASVQKVPITGKYISKKTNPLWITNDFFCSESESTASSWWSSSTVALLQWASTLQSMKFSYLPNCSTNQSTACVAQYLSLEMPEHNKWRWQILGWHVQQWHVVAGCFQLYWLAGQRWWSRRNGLRSTLKNSSCLLLRNLSLVASLRVQKHAPW